MQSAIRGPHSPPFVLVVLDQPVLAEVVRLALGHAQLLARVAPTVAAAVAELRTAPPIWRSSTPISAMASSSPNSMTPPRPRTGCRFWP
jgi:hypothetical protein